MLERRETESLYNECIRLGAGVAELADAQDLGSCGLKTVEVQILSPAPCSPPDWLLFRFAKPRIHD